MAEISPSPNDNNVPEPRKESPVWLRTIYALLALLALGIALIYGVTALQNGASPAMPLFILLLVGIAFLHWILITRQRDDFKRLRAALNADVTRGLKSVEAKASGLLASKVDVLAKRSDVLETIAEVYKEAAESAEKKKSEGLVDRPETIILFGASSIQPKGDEPMNSSEMEETPSEKLEKTRAKAEAQGVRFDRYVRLFDEKNFMGRSPGIRYAYLVWLQGQISLLTRSPLHTLYNARRAPRWKAIRSSVASDTTFVDILGDGESGFAIRGEQFAKSQKRNSKEYINDPTGGRDPIIAIYRQQTVDELKRHLEEMTQLNDTPKD